WSRTGDMEIDVVATSKQEPVLLGSCKWSAKAPASVLDELRDQQRRLGKKAVDATLAVFARGFASALTRQADDEGVLLVSAADLFS
ncbi:MAG TPA: hypothetical protein VFT19_09985, partial [Solirubrobacterales bacterium]|nr:hypothetical protein [Solirubrobacterales bacterium]